MKEEIIECVAENCPLCGSNAYFHINRKWITDTAITHTMILLCSNQNCVLACAKEHLQDVERLVEIKGNKESDDIGEHIVLLKKTNGSARRVVLETISGETNQKIGW